MTLSSTILQRRQIATQFTAKPGNSGQTFDVLATFIQVREQGEVERADPYPTARNSKPLIAKVDRTAWRLETIDQMVWRGVDVLPLFPYNAGPRGDLWCALQYDRPALFKWIDADIPVMDQEPSSYAMERRASAAEALVKRGLAPWKSIQPKQHADLALEQQS